jgi:hypothetical protein
MADAKSSGSRSWLSTLLSAAPRMGLHPITAALISALVSGVITVGGPVLKERLDQSIVFDIQDTVADSCFVSEELHVTIIDGGRQVYSNWLVVDQIERPTDDVTAKLEHPGLYHVSVTGHGRILGSVSSSHASGDFPFAFNGVVGQRYLLNSQIDVQQCGSPPKSYRVTLVA